MSPLFEPDLGGVRASTRIFEPGEYVVEIDEIRGIGYEKEDGTQVAGCRFMLKMHGQIQPDGEVDDEFEGEDVTPYRAYVHTEGAMAFTKRFLMAAMGYSRHEEDQFDEDWVNDADLGVEFEADEVKLGESWNDPVGNRMIISLSKGEHEGREQQDFDNFQPIDSL